MWIYAIYCVGVFNACQGIYATESNPRFGFSVKTYQECADQATKLAQQETVEHPGADIHWRCIDTTKAKVTEDK